MSGTRSELDGEQRRVLDWAAQHRRDLPWRRTRDPWAVLVSEVMLQQTQVERVEPRWAAFLDRWPTTAACAAAPLGEVLIEWQGLGYPRRARALHATAQLIEGVHGGRFPDELGALLTLPGVGPYTARAVLAFAFDADVAVLDTNVGRILARRDGTALSPRSAQQRADAWLPAGEGWAWNQALLDVGARHCRPRTPACGGCPVAPGCSWHRAGYPDPDPATGSAAVSRPQARFEGSVRQARGRVMAVLAAGPVELAVARSAIGWHDRDDGATAGEAVIESLLSDGLAVLDEHGQLGLPS